MKIQMKFQHASNNSWIRDWQGDPREEITMGDLTGKVVLITGAGLGIGRELAISFAAQGDIVVANDITPINLDETINGIQGAGGQAQAYVADIASKLGLQTMLNEIIDQHGRIDVLIQTTSAEPLDPILEIDEWHWRRTLDINLTGPFLLMQSVGRVMREQGSGVIVNIISVDGNSSAAIAGKTGLIEFSRAAASEFGENNLQVNVVCSNFPAAEKIAALPQNPINLIMFLCSAKGAQYHGRVIQMGNP